MKAAIYLLMKIETIVIDLLQFSTMKKFDLINLFTHKVAGEIQQI